MSKADAKRDRIVDQLADFLLAQGLAAASLRPLAAAAGTSDRMLLYYFQDKEEIIAATLERVAQRLTAVLPDEGEPVRAPAPELETLLLTTVTDPKLWPSMCIWLEVAASAARGDPLYQRVGRGIGLGFHAWIAARVEGEDQAARDAAAWGLLRTLEGALLLRSVGLPDTAA